VHAVQRPGPPIKVSAVEVDAGSRRPPREGAGSGEPPPWRTRCVLITRKADDPCQRRGPAALSLGPVPVEPQGVDHVATPEPSASTAPNSRPSFRRTLANRPFLFVWVAQLISQSGDFIFEVALLWLVLAITGSAFAVGLVVTGTILPAVLLGPILGVYVDRWNRRRTLMITNVVEGITVAGLSVLVLTGRVDLVGLLAVVFALGTGATLVRTATNAYVPSVVSVDDLPPANSLLQFSGSFNQIIGLSLGGVFVAAFGIALPIEYDALSFFAAAVLLTLIPRDPTSAVRSPAPPPQSFRTELAEGFAFVRRNRFMIELIALGMIVNFFGNGLAALLPPFAKFVLHGGPAVFGLLGAAIAVGSLVAGLAMGRVDTHRTAGKYLFGGGVVLGLGVLAVGFTTTFPLAVGAMLLIGATLSVVNIPIGVVFQAKVPRPLLGRVGATFGAMISATSPLGPLFAGWLAEQWTTPDVFILSGAVIAGVIGVGAFTMPALRRVEY